MEKWALYPIKLIIELGYKSMPNYNTLKRLLLFFIKKSRYF